jgi:hypothetical protein
MSKATELLKVLPDHIFIYCAAIALDTRKLSFRIGQIANEIKGHLEADGQIAEEMNTQRPDKYSVMDVYEAVSIMLNHEYSPRTVRDFARIESLFDKDVQEEFDILPFSHFRFAAQLPKPLEGLQISMAETGRRNGTPPPVSWLEHWFFSGNYPPEPTVFEPTVNIRDEIADYPDDGGQAVAVKTKPRLWQFTESFETVLDELSLPEIVHNSVLSLWRQIVSILDGYK